MHNILFTFIYLYFCYSANKDADTLTWKTHKTGTECIKEDKIAGKENISTKIDAKVEIKVGITFKKGCFFFVIFLGYFWQNLGGHITGSR
jgi:hypothetical protein